MLGSLTMRCVSGSFAARRDICSSAIGLPQAVDDVGRVACDVVLLQLQVLSPQAQPRRTGDLAVMADDVHLRVVEERVLVQVGGSDRQPRVVDDADLGVHVNGIAQLSVARVDRAGEEPAGAVIGLDQLGEHASGVVHAGVRLRGKHEEHAEAGRGGTIELVPQRDGDLR